MQTPFEKAYDINTVAIWKDYIHLAEEAQDPFDVAWGYYGLGRKYVEDENYTDGQQNLEHARTLFYNLPKDDDRNSGLFETLYWL